ncbi:MAG: hypothetical protein HQ519_01705 [Planctomycetes bacterium]|nr:hypothetical protein [Planctomycetota bacterium]
MEKPEAHKLNHPNSLHLAMELLSKNGFECLADARTILVNDAMKIAVTEVSILLQQNTMAYIARQNWRTQVADERLARQYSAFRCPH